MKTPYDVLGVTHDADEKAIAVAFRNAAKTCHPDLNHGDRRAEQQFKQLIAARDALKNPEWRALYRYLQFRRQHDRRHWMITIASCALSAVVSAGLVGMFQKASESEPLREPQAAAAAGLNPGKGGEPPPPNDLRTSPATAARDGATDATPWPDPGRAGVERQDLAALASGSALPAGTPEATVPESKQAEPAGRPSKAHAAKGCNQGPGKGGAGTQPGDRCSGSARPAQTAAKPNPKPTPRPNPKPNPHPSASAETAKPAKHTLFALLHRGAGASAAAAKAKQASNETGSPQGSRPTYARSGCWTNEGGARWMPCGTNGGE